MRLTPLAVVGSRRAMVQLKYFGDSRDYFKYDLITEVIEHTSLRHYVFVPMLTKHRDNSEGQKASINRGDKSEDLLRFIAQCGYKSLTHWEHWLQRYVLSYTTVEPVDSAFFSDDDRKSYWSAFLPKLSQKNALVFIDPDTGLETGKPSYLKSMGRDKYILNDELRRVVAEIDDSSVLMLYQHLPNDKRGHMEAIEKKLRQVRSNVPCIYACAYREDDLAFICVSKTEALHDEITRVLAGYHANSVQKYKSIHIERLGLKD
jgi:hypothetical protein